MNNIVIASYCQMLSSTLLIEINCYMPANGETVDIPIPSILSVDMSLALLKRDQYSMGEEFFVLMWKF